MLIRADTGEALSPIDAFTALTRPELLEAQKALLLARDAAIKALVTPNDIQSGFWKRSAWRKIGRAFQLSQETVYVDRVVTESDEPGIPFHVVATVRVRTWAPWGQYVETTGVSTTREATWYNAAGQPRTNAFMRAEHDCTAKAETRAKNKGIDDIMAIGKAENIELDSEREERIEERLDKREGQWKAIISKAGIEIEAELAYYSLNPHLPDSAENFGVEDFERCIRHWGKHGSLMFDRAVEELKKQEGDPWEDILDREFVDGEFSVPEGLDEAERIERADIADAEEAAALSSDLDRMPQEDRTEAAEVLFGDKEPEEPTLAELEEQEAKDGPGTSEKIDALAQMADYAKRLGEDESYPFEFAHGQLAGPHRQLKSLFDLTAGEAIEMAELLRKNLATVEAGAS